MKSSASRRGIRVISTFPIICIGTLKTDSKLGTSVTPEERVKKNLTGLIPHVMENMDTQVMRAMKMINSRSTPLDKYLYLSTLKSSNIDLFYRVLIDNVEQLMP